MRWKEASTVIIAAKNKTNEQFQILSLQRSEKSSFLPNVHVFPGGLVDDSDSSVEWLKVFKNNIQHYVNLDKIEFHMTNPISHQSNVYKVTHNNCKDNLNYLTLNELKQNKIDVQNKVLPKYISLRITAIREAFEESGILLCKPNSQVNSKSESTDSSISLDSKLSSENNECSSTEAAHDFSCHIMKNYFHFDTISAWRKKVYNNPLEFINLCILMDCHPDLNNVKIWSNWLSPGNQYFSTRYDSKFFLVMFDETPQCDIDYYEMKSLQWCSPEQLIKDSMEGKIWLPPPQFYECSRLVNFKSISQLNKFLTVHDSSVCEQWLPIRIKAKNGEVGVLPGDWMYPKTNIDIESLDYYNDCSEFTMAELLHNAEVGKLPVHRMQYSGPFRIELVVNNLTSVSHTVPVNQTRKQYLTHKESKL